MSDNKMAPQALVQVDPEMLIEKAISKGLPVETMEKLLAMRRELRAEAARDDYFMALAKFQKLCPVIIKSRDVYDKYGKLRYKFAPLDIIVKTVQEPLEQCGFSYIIKTEQTTNTVKAICEAHHISGHLEITDFTIPIDPEAFMNEAQKVASALTYSKRYAFCNAFGILTGDEDRDGNGNNKTEIIEKPQKKKALIHDPSRQKIVDKIVNILTDKVFNDKDRVAVKAEIKMAKSNFGLEALRATWEAEQNKRIEKFEDDIPVSAEEEKKIDEATKSLFPEEEKAAQELADRKALETPDIY